MNEIWIPIKEQSDREKLVYILANNGCKVVIKELNENSLFVVFEIPNLNVKESK
jgi:hypothetical protein